MQRHSPILAEARSRVRGLLSRSRKNVVAALSPLDQIVNYVGRAREMTDRNAALAKALREREQEKQDNEQTYKTQAMFHQVLMVEMQEQILLNVMLRKAVFGEPAECPMPIRDIPAELRNEFLLGGKVEFVDQWVDDTYPSNYPLIYTDAEISTYQRRVGENKTYIYGGLDEYFRSALEKYPVRDLNVVNLGSITPWYEATLLAFGAKPTTLDYNTIITQTTRIETMVVDPDRLADRQFDAAVSISSFEHDGLGAYGDPIDPNGDLKTMKKLKGIVKPGGLLYLNVPTGKDQLMWNRARVYGKARLPLLFEGWSWIDTFGMREEFLEGKFNGDPLYVLRND
jgi:SAM-dependent methyltransferase